MFVERTNRLEVAKKLLIYLTQRVTITSLVEISGSPVDHNVNLGAFNRLKSRGRVGGMGGDDGIGYLGLLRPT